MSLAPIARPLTLPNGFSLRNRLAKAAMSEVLGTPEGAPGDRLIRLYERFAASGAGLLLTGHVIVARGGEGEPGNVLIEDDRHLLALRRWASVSQAGGAAAFVQLNHTGRQSPRRLTPEPVAPSAVPLKGFFGTFAKPRALDEAEIEGIIDAFGNAARVVREAGFSGVQLHGAHGYLVSAFLSPLTNLRTDAWGGDLDRRMRFPLRVVRAMRAATSPSFPIAVKLNSADFQRGGFELEDSKRVAQALEAEGIDLLEVSGGNYESPAMAGRGELPERRRASTLAREAYFLEYAEELRQVTRVPLMLTGGLRTAAGMNQAIESGAVDVLGLGRPLTVEPDLPARLLSGAATAARAVRVDTGIKKFDDMLQVFWYQQQLHRMASGLDPDLSLGRLAALATGVKHTLFAA